MAENDESTVQALERLRSIRQSIDNIDAAVIHMLAERFKFTQQVGALKAEHGLPPADPEREREQIQRLRVLAEESHLDPAFAPVIITVRPCASGTASASQPTATGCFRRRCARGGG